MPSIKLRTCARTHISIGSNQSSKSWVLVQAAECSATDFVLLLPMAWSPPAWQRRNRLGWTTRRLRHFQFPPIPLRHPKVRRPVVRIAGWRETKTLKPIDEVSLRGDYESPGRNESKRRSGLESD